MLIDVSVVISGNSHLLDTIQILPTRGCANLVGTTVTYRAVNLQQERSQPRRVGRVDSGAGDSALNTSWLRDILHEVRSAIRHFAADKLAAAEAMEAVDNVAEDATTAGGEASATAGDGTAVVRKINGYASREEALAELTRIAGYFRKTEPHSPISYTLEDAVRRARMTLPELLVELAEDPTHIQRILMAAGIKPPDTESEASGY